MRTSEHTSDPKFDRQSSTIGAPPTCRSANVYAPTYPGSPTWISTPRAATERVVVLMTPKQKADASRRAKAARLSLGDFIRRQILGDEELLSVVVAELEESTATATAALDSAAARLADAQAFRPEREAQARARARAEFADVEPEAIAELVAGAPGSLVHPRAGQ